MKNLKGIILTAALAAIFTGQIFAQATTPAASSDQTTKQTATQVQTPGKFVDNNNNGVCDNHETMKGKSAKGANFVDANGDGVCDHRADSNCGNGKQCCGKGHGQGNGCSKGSGCQHGKGFGGPCGGQTTPGKK